MGATKVAPEPDDDDAVDAVKAREVMLAKMSGSDWKKERDEWNYVMHEEEAINATKAAMKKTNKDKKTKDEKALDARKMKRFNNLINVKLVYGTTSVMIETQASIYLNKLQAHVMELLNIDKKRLQLLWLTRQGETVLLDSQRVMDQFQDAEWATQPWVIHVNERPLPPAKTGKGRKDKGNVDSGGEPTKLSLVEQARALFDRFDINDNKQIDRSELARMLKEVDLSQLSISSKNMDRYIQAQFNEQDEDSSGGIDLSEFTKYVTEMTMWMREELMASASRKNVFATLASRAIEIRGTPMHLPADGVVDAGRFGLSLSVPHGVLAEGIPAASQVCLRTLAPMRVGSLSEAEARKRGEFCFSLVVQVDYPAAGDRNTPPAGPKFASAPTLTMPHCFSHNVEEASESCMLLGAPHGATSWQVIDALSTENMSNPITWREDGSGLMDVKLPFAGVFCAFSNPNVEDVSRVKFHVFAAPQCARDAPSTIRIHLCPELPDQLEEMVISEDSVWGLSTRVGGFTEAISAFQGTYFHLKFQGQTRLLKWHGSRVSTEFTYVPPTGIGPSVDENIYVDLGECPENEGKRAHKVANVVKQTGMSQIDHPVPFTLKMSSSRRPGPPAQLELMERTQWDFTCTWFEPAPAKGEDKPPPITHYAIELATPGVSGTYGAFREIWTGVGAIPPDFTTEAQGPAAADNAADGAAEGVEDGEEAEMEKKPFSYTLVVEPGLFGRLRMRCWAEGELRPSCYSAEAKLPRYQGKVETKNTERKALEKARAEYDSMTGRPKPSSNDWASSAVAAAPKPKTKAASKLPAVPYDVPEPPQTPGLQECGTRLAEFFEGVGVIDRGSGLHLGVTIDHVLAAVAQGRTKAGMAQPLMALLEVVYADVLLPMLDTVVVLEREIDFVLEKVGGIIAQCGKHAATSYGACEVHIEMLLSVVQEVYETVRQCEFEMLLANHLNDVEYPKALRRTLKGELSDRIVDTLWRLSTELLKLQLTVLDADEGNAVPKSDQVSRMAVAAAVADFAQKEKSKRGGLFSFWRK